MAINRQSESLRNTVKLVRGESVLLEPVNRLLAAIPGGQQRITPHTIEQAQQAMRLLEELHTYTPSADPHMTRKELEAGRKLLGKIVSSREAEEAFLRAGEHPQGRPIKRRYVAAVALEEKQRSPSLKRIELAQKFCPCDKAHHNAKCAERLRRDIQRLKALIRRILCEYPT